MRYTRRDFGKIALAGVPAAGLLLEPRALFAAAQGKPNSKWAGVQVGMNVPYNFGGGNFMTGDEIINRCVQLGVSATELRGQPVELFLGSPAAMAGAAAQAARGAGGGGRAGGGGAAAAGGAATAATAGAAQAGAAGAGAQAGAGAGRAAGATGAAQAGAGGRGGGRAALTPEQEAAQKAAAEDTRKWRMRVSMDRVKDFRKKFDDAGVLIEIVKWDGIFNMSDDEVDYCFQVSKALGAYALSTEISAAGTKRVGQFADKNKMMIGYHGHTETGPAEWEAAFAEAKFNGANLDIGHYVAGHNVSPVPFLKAQHDRITHIHVKDRKLGTNGGQNVPFGQGDTPIREVLRLIRDNKWKIQATIEFEYPVPAGSDRMAEIAKSVQYCKDCLLT